jgi:hypothetical protein
MRIAVITNVDNVPSELRYGLRCAVDGMDFSTHDESYWNSFVFDNKTYDVNIYESDDPTDKNWYGAIQDTVVVEGEDFLDQGSVIATFGVTVVVKTWRL